MKNQFVKRLKSFFWRLSAYLTVAAAAWMGANLGILELSPSVQAVLALVLGEVTKYLNSKPAFVE